MNELNKKEHLGGMKRMYRDFEIEPVQTLENEERIFGRPLVDLWRPLVDLVALSPFGLEGLEDHGFGGFGRPFRIWRFWKAGFGFGGFGRPVSDLEALEAHSDLEVLEDRFGFGRPLFGGPFGFGAPFLGGLLLGSALVMDMDIQVMDMVMGSGYGYGYPGYGYGYGYPGYGYGYGYRLWISLLLIILQDELITLNSKFYQLISER